MSAYIVSVGQSHHVSQLFRGEIVHVQLATVQVLQEQFKQLGVCVMYCDLPAMIS